MRGRTRIIAGCAAVALAAGSIGAVELRGSAASAKPKLTRQQIGAKKLLAEYAQYGDCGCTGATRAKDRVRSGLAKKVVAASGGSAATP
jgi:hypothetical protein